jgi:hypothetical protein
LTIAKEELEIDLKAQEKNHACKGLDLLGLSIVGLPVRKMPELVIGYDYGPDKFAIAAVCFACCQAMPRPRSGVKSPDGGHCVVQSGVRGAQRD